MLTKESHEATIICFRGHSQSDIKIIYDPTKITH